MHPELLVRKRIWLMTLVLTGLFLLAAARIAVLTTSEAASLTERGIRQWTKAGIVMLAEAASEEEAAVEAEPPQAVMPAARARATTAMQIFLSFISMISLFFLCVFRSGPSVAPHCDAIF